MALKTVDSLVDELVDKRIHLVREHEYFIARQIRSLCESPIEERLGVAFWHTDWPLYFSGNDRALPLKALSEPFSDEYVKLLHSGKGTKEYIVIYAQQQVLQYRVDFLICAQLGNYPDFHKVVVECDGHDFHEKTKEQAAHDKKRDRVMTAAGFRVFRFTGSEIYKDAPACANEVSEYLRNRFWELEKAAYGEAA